MKRQQRPLVTVVIPAKNERKTIGAVVKEALQIHARTQVIVVVNGSDDGTADVAKRAGAQVFEFEQALGHDTGRAYGAKMAKGQVVLFLDGDFVVKAKELKPFAKAVLQKGVDLALNAYPMAVHAASFSTLMAKSMLNLVHGRRDLLASSMTAVPHALSRRAVKHLSLRELANPPLAQSRLLQGEFVVRRVHYVPVHMMNKKRSLPEREKRALTELILGDHLQAIEHLLREKGVRGGFTDLERMRGRLDFDIEGRPSNQDGLTIREREASEDADVDLALERHRKRDLDAEFDESDAEEELTRPEAAYHRKEKPDVCAVICAHNEEQKIAQVVRSAWDAGVTRVLVVDNGSSDMTRRQARRAGAEVLHYSERLGHDVGRAIGAAEVEADAYLFLDGDMEIDSRELRPFVEAVLQDGVDVALNDLNDLLTERKRTVDAVTIAKRMLNSALCREDLGANSLVAVPHALSRRAVEKISPAALAVPPLAMVRAVLSELVIEQVHTVNVIACNPIREHLHQSPNGNLVAQMIIGDHLEALRELFDQTGKRGLFGADGRVFKPNAQ